MCVYIHVYVYLLLTKMHVHFLFEWFLDTIQIKNLCYMRIIPKKKKEYKEIFFFIENGPSTGLGFIWSWIFNRAGWGLLYFLSGRLDLGSRVCVEPRSVLRPFIPHQGQLKPK